MVKWELDLWYEMWERAGSEGLDTWHELPDRRAAACPAADVVAGSSGQPEAPGRQAVPEWEGG
jgi:hypothetical protein